MLATQVESTRNDEDPGSGTGSPEENGCASGNGEHTDIEEEEEEDESDDKEEEDDDEEEEQCSQATRPIPIFSVSSPSPMGSRVESPV